MEKDKNEGWILATKPNGCMVNMTRRQYEKWLKQQETEKAAKAAACLPEQKADAS